MVTAQPVSRRRLLEMALGGAAVAGLGACGVSGTARAVPFPAPASRARLSTPAPLSTPSPLRKRVLDAVDLGPLPPNELGQIPVLMMHRVTSPIISEYDITPDALWLLLTRLHAEGYRPVRAVDLVRGRLRVPRGRTPVVLTFDDSSPGQFHRRFGGGVDPRSGIGVLQAFSRRHPAFTPTATLYLNGHPFEAPDTGVALRSLDAAGYELGNHTLDHVNLGNVSARVGQQEIVELQNLIGSAVPGRRPATFSLPYGVWPADRGLASAGTWQGSSYRHEGIMLVGAEPTASPFSLAWDPTAISRIRASSWAGGTEPYGATWWLDRLAADPPTQIRQRWAAGKRRLPATRERQAQSPLPRCRPSLPGLSAPVDRIP